MSKKDGLKKYYYVYYSYEQWGRGYIGKRECWCLPEEDTEYLGSYTDKTFKPTEKIILQTFDTQSDAYGAEVKLHDFYEVDINPHFANKAKQKRKRHGKYNYFEKRLKIEDEKFKKYFIDIVKSSITIKEILEKLGFKSCGNYKIIKKWINVLNLDISHFRSNSFYKHETYDDVDDHYFIKAVNESESVAQVLKKLNIKITGSSYNRIKKRIKLLEIDTSHFLGQGWSRGKTHITYLTEEQKDKSHYKYLYTITTPSGEIIRTKNLKQFCKENKLNQRNMWLVGAERNKTCKGYKVSKEPLDIHKNLC